jgi:hypothetical protein
MRAVPLPRGLGFDSSAYVRPEAAQWLRNAGFQWVARYGRRDGTVLNAPDAEGTNSLSRRELAELLSAGLDVLLLQFGKGSLNLSLTSADADAAAAVSVAHGLGAPKGIHLALNFEPSTTPTKAQAAGYIERYADHCRAQGFRCLLYYGTTTPFDSAELGALRGVSAYWRPACAVPYPSGRGAAIQQTLPVFLTTPGGYRFEVDQDVGCTDAWGERPMLIGAGF